MEYLFYFIHGGIQHYVSKNLIESGKCYTYQQVPNLGPNLFGGISSYPTAVRACEISLLILECHYKYSGKE